MCPYTVHCAVDKACHYFGVEQRKAPLSVTTGWPTSTGSPTTSTRTPWPSSPRPATTRTASSTRSTSSASSALEHGIGLHVDGCLGGFILPWGEELGYACRRFDFRVPGVTSISADTHKYGYALKGTSVLVLLVEGLRRHQYFTAAEWPGGTYLSPGMAGSRSGGLIAATWAAMVTLGEAGYRAVAADIFATAATLRAGIEAIARATRSSATPRSSWRSRRTSSTSSTPTTSCRAGAGA